MDSVLFTNAVRSRAPHPAPYDINPSDPIRFVSRRILRTRFVTCLEPDFIPMRFVSRLERHEMNRVRHDGPGPFHQRGLLQHPTPDSRHHESLTLDTERIELVMLDSVTESIIRFSYSTPSNPGPHTLHPTLFSRHPTPYTLHPTPFTLNPALYTLHPTPYTMNQSCSTLNESG